MNYSPNLPDGLKYDLANDDISKILASSGIDGAPEEVLDLIGDICFEVATDDDIDPTIDLETSEAFVDESAQIELTSVIEASNVVSDEIQSFLVGLGYELGDDIHLRLLPAKGYDPDNSDHAAIFPKLRYQDKKGKWITSQKNLKLANNRLVWLTKSKEIEINTKGNPENWLKSQSKLGYCPYIVVNPGGHSKSKITKARVIFWEHDDLPKGEQVKRFKEYSDRWNGAMAVETLNSIHCYIRLDQDLMPNLIQPTLLRLIQHMGSDKTVNDECRLMRVPGFDHISIVDNAVKRFPITLLHSWDGSFASWQTIDRELPQLLEDTEKPPTAKKNKQPSINSLLGSSDLSTLLERDILPRLNAEQIFNWAGHDFKAEPDGKLKGNCPWHDSKSGTAFWVTPSRDGSTWVGGCPSCCEGNERLNPIRYRHSLKVGYVSTEQPKGQDFIEVVKNLAFEAGITIPAMSSSAVLSSVDFDWAIESEKLRDDWLTFDEATKSKRLDNLLVKAVPHIDKAEIDLLLTQLGFDLKKEYPRICYAVNIVVGNLRKENRFSDGANFTGGYFWTVLKSHKIEYDYLRLIKKFGTNLKFNLLKKQVELNDKVISVGSSIIDLSVDHGFTGESGLQLPDVVLKVAKSNAYHPVKIYLDSVADKFEPDSKIIENLAERYLGQSDSIYNRMLCRTLIAAVARIYEPGCKHDTALFLQGKQGFNKSTFFKVLAGGNECFDDSLGSVTDKDEKLKMHRVWIVEWAELETVFKKKDISATKAFLSSQVDSLRPPYGRDTEDMPRMSIIVGSTNQDEFLSDSTGSRRFWVIPVAKKINCDLLKRERDEIWAAIVHQYRKGVQWHLTDKEEIQAQAVAEAFQTSHPWTQPVIEYATKFESVSSKDVLDDALHIELPRQTRADEMIVSGILKQAGWTIKRPTIKGKKVSLWFKPESRSV